MRFMMLAFSPGPEGPAYECVQLLDVPVIGMSERPHTSFDGSAPGLGRYFCVRPPNTSERYRLPSESAEIWCIAHVYPGLVPNWPNEYSTCPDRSNLTMRSVRLSTAQTCSSALIIMLCGAMP